MWIVMYLGDTLVPPPSRTTKARMYHPFFEAIQDIFEPIVDKAKSLYFQRQICRDFIK